MNKKLLREKAIEIMESSEEKKLELSLGCGIARKVYILTDDLVMKVEYKSGDSSRCRCHNLGMIESKSKNKARLAGYVNRCKLRGETIKPRAKLFKEYNDFLQYTGLNMNSRTITKFMRTKLAFRKLQNLAEICNYNIVSNNKKVSKYLLKTYDYFEHGHYSIIIQERGKATNQVYDMRELRIKTVEMRRAFNKESYELIDIHRDNLVLDKNNKIKICDTGFCGFGWVCDDSWD